jgi:nucleotide-binding universal stress UspA family protein
VIGITAAPAGEKQTKLVVAEADVRILLAIDESAGSETALQAVVNQANPTHTAEVKVLTVVEPPSASVKFAVAAAGQMAGYPASFAPELEAESKRAQALVDKAVEELQQSGLRATGTVESGEPKSVIVDTAAQWNADLIVVGAHGRTALERFLIGSVSEAVARHAACSVEIVRTRARTDAAGRLPQRSGT